MLECRNAYLTYIILYNYYIILYYIILYYIILYEIHYVNYVGCFNK